MSIKTIDIDDIGLVKITKKRGMKSIRLRIGANDQVLVSAPYFVPLPLIKDYIHKNKSWIKENRSPVSAGYYHGFGIGRHGTLRLVLSDKEGVWLDPTGVTVKANTDEYLQNHHDKITKGIYRYLQRETDAFVLPRLLELSRATDLSFHQANCKRLRGRWGSCDNKQNIVINIYLAQLNQQLIDYVLLHELAHTQHMNHSKMFWVEVAKHCPDYKQIRKDLKVFKPQIYDRNRVSGDYDS